MAPNCCYVIRFEGPDYNLAINPVFGGLCYKIYIYKFDKKNAMFLRKWKKRHQSYSNFVLLYNR